MERLSKHFSAHSILLTVMVGMMFFVISAASDISGRLVAQELQKQEVLFDDDDKSPPPPPAGAREMRIRIFLQGYYINQSEDIKLRQAHDLVEGDIVPRFTLPKSDNITVRLHAEGDYNNVLFTVENVSLLVSGWTVRFQIPDHIQEDVWVSVKHRNHLETVWHTTIDLGASLQGSLTTLDFTTEIGDGAGGMRDPSYEENQHQFGDGRFGIYLGDISGGPGGEQDGRININDLNPLIAGIRANDRGYDVRDVTGDGRLNINDSNPLISNMRSNIRSRTP